MNAIFYNSPFRQAFIPEIYGEIYKKNLYAGIETDTMIDLGANIGLVTHYFKDKAKKIYAVEPSKMHFEALKANKEYNHWDNVELHNVAISDKTGEAKLFHNPKNVTSHSLVENFNEGSEMVKTMRLDDFFKENGIEKIDFIKVDIEGAEDILFNSEGFLNVKEKISSMLVEFHTNDRQQIKNSLKHLRRHGFPLKEWKMRWICYLVR